MASHKLSYFNSRIFTADFSWDCCRILGAEKCSRMQVNLKGLLEKSDITYPSRNSYNVISWGTLRNYVEDLGLWWNDRGRKRFHLLDEEVQFLDRGTTFSNIINRRSQLGASHRGTWTGCPDVLIKNVVIVNIHFLLFTITQIVFWKLKRIAKRIMQGSHTLIKIEIVFWIFISR